MDRRSFGSAEVLPEPPLVMTQIPPLINLSAGSDEAVSGQLEADYSGWFCFRFCCSAGGSVKARGFLVLVGH